MGVDVKVLQTEVEKLKQQCETLKERLDYMAPLLSMQHFMQDYIQKLEGEASVQLMRLKRARVNSAGRIALAGSGEASSEPDSVDSAKWMHKMTDLVLRASGESAPVSPLSPASGSGVASWSSTRAGTTVAMAGPAAAPAHHAEWHAEVGRRLAPSPQLAARLPEAASVSGLQVQRGLVATPAPPPSSATAGGSSTEAPFAFSGILQPKQDLSHRVGYADSIPAPFSRGAQTFAAGGSSSSSAGVRRRVSETEAAGATGALAGLARGREPIPKKELIYNADPLQNTLECGGLALGKGTWATAYRQAIGARRDALRLLCTSGIVTERELADDLTVISEEHIEECVAIASEMLKKWPPEQGPVPQAEAKTFFQDKLQALYMKRAPSPFG
eukprot:TRINITY_DN11386_c0_g1_i6.p1 TRINITY_DN11386_c0_g1~~TRINITY_DN11386_c0_g1_i6.p1  ORF type:complete len:387 (-),score=76.33 TRINITY_DN11386_c0_g1_i6:204-1364(-)